MVNGSDPKVLESTRPNNGPSLVHGYDEIAGHLLNNQIPDATPTDVLRVYGIIVTAVTADDK